MKKSALILGLAIFGAALLPAAKTSGAYPPFPAKSETVHGSLSNVNLDKKLIAVTTPDHVVYDFKLTDAKTVKMGDRQIKLNELQNQIGKQTEVDYRPLRTGDMALKIEVQ